jgi:hypothetical protein
MEYVDFLMPELKMEINGQLHPLTDFNHSTRAISVGVGHSMCGNETSLSSNILEPLSSVVHHIT